MATYPHFTHLPWGKSVFVWLTCEIAMISRIAHYNHADGQRSLRFVGEPHRASRGTRRALPEHPGHRRLCPQSEVSKQFYVDQLGFELITEQCLPTGVRWIEVAPPASVAKSLYSMQGKVPGYKVLVVVVMFLTVTGRCATRPHSSPDQFQLYR